MNCPSRTETDPTARDGWNQNPPALAAETTTREDLNGRANRREVDPSDTSKLDGRDTDRRKDAPNIDTTDGRTGVVALEMTESDSIAPERRPSRASS